jgi:hypothetical protein
MGASIAIDIVLQRMTETQVLAKELALCHTGAVDTAQCVQWVKVQAPALYLYASQGGYSYEQACAQLHAC